MIICIKYWLVRICNTWSFVTVVYGHFEMGPFSWLMHCFSLTSYSLLLERKRQYMLFFSGPAWFLSKSDANLYIVAVELTWRTQPLPTRTPCCFSSRQGWNTKSLSGRDTSPKINYSLKIEAAKPPLPHLSLKEDLVQTTDFIVHFLKEPRHLLAEDPNISQSVKR